MEKIKIGTIFNTHALKGEVKVKSFSEFNTQRFKVGNTLFIRMDKEDVEVVVQSYREHQGIVLLSFKDKQDINLVECYKGCDLYINRELIQDDGDGYYFFDLKGCKVYDQNKQLLGIVEDILQTGANPVLRVNKTILIPYVDVFVKKVDIKNKEIYIEVIEGML